MNQDHLSWAWEVLRYKVTVLEKEFIEKNKKRYDNYYELRKALNRYLERSLKSEKEQLIALQITKIKRKSFL